MLVTLARLSSYDLVFVMPAPGDMTWLRRPGAEYYVTMSLIDIHRLLVHVPGAATTGNVTRLQCM